MNMLCATGSMEALFVSLARHIYRREYEAKFYEIMHIYFDYGEHTYWTTENTLNRCLISQVSDRRTKEGLFPATK